MADSGSRWPAGIRTPDQRLRVFVSSTLGELGAERGAARAAIEQLRLVPRMFASGARPPPAQAAVQGYLEPADLFFCLFSAAHGLVPSGVRLPGPGGECPP